MKLVALKDISELPITFGPEMLCSILGISRNNAYKLANSSDFPKTKIGRKIIISKKHFIAWLDITMAGEKED